MNVFAEGILTIPPTKISVNLFNFVNDLKYDISSIEKVGITSYEEISEFITRKEYEDLPCKYMYAAQYSNGFSLNDFEDVIRLYRD